MTASQLVTVCLVDELPPGEARRVETDPPIAVFNVDGLLYAIDDTCSHADASLADGYINGCFVECPYHLTPFDLRSGRPTSLPATKPVRTHTVEVHEGLIVVIVGVPPDNAGVPCRGHV